MKALILCAGSSTRTHPLTITRPKPMLKVANKMILEHTLENLSGLIDEAVIVVGFKKEMIISCFGSKYKNIKLTYVEQKEQLGTGHAIMSAKDSISDRFIVIPGDDLISKKDLINVLENEYGWLLKEVENPSLFGIVSTQNGKAASVEEKPKNPKSNLASTGCFIADKRLIEMMQKLPKSQRGEYEITDALNFYIKERDMVCVTVSDYWLPISYPWDILAANEFLLNRIERSDFIGETEEGVTVNGKVILGKGSIILAGSYLEGNIIIGENCRVGPNAYIRGNTSIGNNCRVGPAEVKNCVFFDNVRCDHVSYVGDSVLGDGAHLGAHTVIANLRHDKSTIRSEVKGELVDTKRKKLGAIIGDNANIGINTSIYPGRKIWPRCYTAPAEIVKKDVVSNDDKKKD